MTRKVLVLGIAILMGLAAFAQEFPRAEVGIVYSYTRFSPSLHYSPNMNINGGGGSFTFNLNRYFGIKSEFVGGGASKATWTVPVGNAVFPAGASIKSSGNLFSYLFGPQIRIPSQKISPYFNFLFGGVHTSAFADAIAACQNCTTSAAPSGNSFGMAIGGGLDLPVTHVVAIKVAQVDYLMTRFNNGLTGADNQHNFRYSAGLVFRFGNH